jgi:hypothetical protein
MTAVCVCRVVFFALMLINTTSFSSPFKAANLAAVAIVVTGETMD